MELTPNRRRNSSVVANNAGRPGASSLLIHQSVFHQTVYRMVGIDTADLADLHLGHRLPVGDNGQRLHDDVCQHMLFRGCRHPDQVLIIICAGAHLVGVFQLQNPHAALFFLAALLQM